MLSAPVTYGGGEAGTNRILAREGKLPEKLLR